MHLVPRRRADWFRRNDMARHNWAGARTGVYDPANGLTLRRDVAIVFNRRALLFFPAGPTRLRVPSASPAVQAGGFGGPGRSDSDTVGDGAAFVHMAVVCKPRYKAYVELEGLHCMPVVLSRRVSDAFLCARFVNAVISLVKRDPAFEVFPLP